MLRPLAPEAGRKRLARLCGGMPALMSALGRAFPAGAAGVLRMRTLFVRVLWPACFALLLPFALLSSSSEADDTAPRLSALEVEKLWSSVLGCADAGDDGETVKNALAGGSAPGGARRDYLDCGTRALRAAASRMLVDTIEDSLRLGGSSLFDQEFRLDSNVTWEIGGDFRGELNTILPIGGVRNNDGTGRALFFQQGITFWEGRNNELRSDSSTGLVYRGHVSRDWILGGSFFFDYNFQREHSRLGVGADVQNGIFHGGLNYYFPPPGGREWRRGRIGYEERVLEGWDLRWSFAWERVRLGGAFGAWVFDGELDGKGSGWRRSASLSADYEFYPGVFFKAGYEYHDGRSAGEDWNLGLAFRYSLPEMEGIGGNGAGGRVPDLWRIVDRERRILYEERLARARIGATLTATPGRAEEGGDVTVRVVLSEALEEDVFFSVAAASSSTAVADDHDPLPSRMTIPAGALSAEETFGIISDGESEPDEILDLELNVLQESFFLVARGNPDRARVVIGASDNSFVGFATESTSVTEGVKVDIPLKLGEPAPADGFVLLVTSSDDKKEDVKTDASMQIVGGVQRGQYIRVTVVDDHVPESTEMVRITLVEPPDGLPGEWRIDRREHMLMIQPHGLVIDFERSSSEAREDAGIVNLVLVLNEPAPAGMVLNVSSDLSGDAVPVHSTLTVPEGAQRIDLPVRVIDDELGEGDEVATIRIFDAGADSMPKGWSVGPQSAHKLTIKDNDLGLGFKRSNSQVHESALSTGIEITLSGIGAPTGGISLSVAAEGNDDNDISFATLVPISAGENSKTLNVTITQDDITEDAERIVLTLSGQLPESWEYGQKTHELTILPNDIDVAFEMSSSRVNENVGTVELALVLDRPAPAGLVLALGSSSPADAAPVNPVLRVPAGATRVTFPVRIAGDDIGEGSETVTISVSESSPPLPKGWRIGSPNTHELTLVDDDLFAGFKHPSSQVHENDLSTGIEIMLSEIGAPDGGISLAVTAEGNEDNDISFMTLVPVSAGENSKTLNVTIAQDNLPEDAERIVLKLSGELPESWSFGQQTHELTILSNDQAAMFAEAGKTVNEGDGTTSFKVALSADAPAGGVPLQVAIASGNDDNDVVFATQKFTIAEGGREHTIHVVINDDNQVEPGETVVFTLTKGAGAAFPDAWGDLGTPTTFALVITDNDSTTIGFATTSSIVREGDTTATLTVTLNGSVSQPVTVTLGESGDDNNDLKFSPSPPDALTFNPGDTSKSVILTINAGNNNTDPEADVQVTYRLEGTLPAGVTFNPREHVVTFVDDDRTIRFKKPASSAVEGTTGHPVAVVLNFDPPPGGLEVTVAATGGHAGEVSIPSPTLNFTGTTRELPVLVDVRPDDLPEDTKVVQLELNETATRLPEGWTLVASGADDDHDLTIPANDQTAMFAEAGKTVNEGDGTTSFKVALSADAPSGGVPLQVAITSGNDDNDVAFTTQNFIIAEGGREHTIHVVINDDNQVEPGETVVFTLTKDAGAAFPDAWGDLGTPATFALVITDNDSTTIGFATTSSIVREGDTTATLTVVLNGSVSQPVTVTLGESGDDNNDLKFSPFPPDALTFNPGDTSKSVILTVNADNNNTDPETDVQVTYRLEGTLPAGVTFNPREHVVTFVDDDRTIRFKKPASSAVEGTTGHPVAVVLNFDPPPGGLEVTVAATGGHAGEVSIPSPTLNFTGTTRELSVLVDVRPDDLPEDEKVVQLELNETATPLPEGWTLVASGAGDDHDLTIPANDQTAMFAEAGKTVNEGDGTASFKVLLSEDAPAGGVPLQVAITSGNDDNDVVFTTQKFIIAEGSREHTINVTINDDNQVEPGETVVFTLTKDASAAFPDTWGDLGTPTTFALVITDNDSTTIGFATTSSIVKEGDATATLTVTLSGSVSQPVTVTLSESGDDNNDLKFSPSPPDALTFNPGDTSKSVILTVNVGNNNTDPEADVQVTYRLEGTLPAGVTFNPREHVVTFVDDDRTIRFKKPASSAAEGTTGHPVAVVLNFDPPPGGLEVAAAASGAHVADVSIPSPVLNFSGSTRELSVLVDVPMDDDQEGAEVVYLELQETTTPLPASWTLLASGDNDHDLTILPSNQTAMFAEAGKTVNEGDGTISFKVVLSEDAPAGGVPLEVAITAGNDDDDEDVTFTTQSFTITEGNREHMLAVAVVDDNLDEPSEVVTFILSKGGGFPGKWGGLGTQTAFDLTIEDNDQPDMPGECAEGLYPDPTNKINGPFKCTSIPPIPARCDVGFFYKGQLLPENLQTWDRFGEIYDREGRFHITQEGYDDRFRDFSVGYTDFNCPPIWVNVVKTTRDGMTPLNPDDIICRCGSPGATGGSELRRIGGYPIEYTYALSIYVVADGTKYTDPLKEEVRERIRLNALDRSGKILASLTWFINAN